MENDLLKGFGMCFISFYSLSDMASCGWFVFLCLLVLFSILSMTSTMKSCEEDHQFLIKHREKRDLDQHFAAPPTAVEIKPRVCAKGDAICIPANYSKFDLPDESLTTVSVGIDIKDIPKIDDKEFSITLNAFFVVLRCKEFRKMFEAIVSAII